MSRFLVVVESGSFNKAAHRLNLSQPALAKSIQLLENSLGATLLDRTPRGVRLTSFGKSTYDHAQRIASEVRQLERNIESIRTLAYGEISVGVPLRQTSNHLARAFLRILSEKRRFKMNIVTGTRSGLIRLMLHGDLDFLFTRLLEDREITNEYRQIELYLDPSAIVVRPAHPLLGRKNTNISHLTKYSWITSYTGVESDRSLGELLGGGFSHSLLRSGSPNFLKNILCGSDFVGLVHRDTMQMEIDEGSLVEVRLSDGPRLETLFPPQKIGIIQRSDVSVTPASQQLISEMVSLADGRERDGAWAREGSKPAVSH